MSTVAYIANGSSVTVIDTSNYKIVAAIPMENPTCLAITPDGKLAYVVNTSCSSVSVIDTSTHTVMTDTPIPVGKAPNRISIMTDGTKAYVANSGDEAVSVIDTDTASATFNTVIATITPYDVPARIGLAVTRDGSRAYAADSGDSVIFVIDASTANVVSTIPTGESKPIDIALTSDGTRAYVTVDAGMVLVIDTDPGSNSCNTVIDTLNIGGSPAGIAIRPSEPWLGTTAVVPAKAADTNVSPAAAGRKYKVNIVFKPRRTDSRTAIHEMLDEAFSAPPSVPAPNRPFTPEADLAVNKSVNRRRSRGKIILAYTISVKNNGPHPAHNIAVTTSLSSNTGFSGATAAQGRISHPTVGHSGAVTCRVGSMKAGAKIKIVIRVEVNPKARTVRTTSQVTSTTVDPNPNNNSAAAHEYMGQPKVSEPKNKSSEPKNKSKEIERELPDTTKIIRRQESNNIVRENKPKKAIRRNLGAMKIPHRAYIQRMTQGKKIIGSGARRIVYDLGDGYVLKVAKSKDGIKSNKKEVTIYNSSTSPVKKYIGNVKDYEDGYAWVVMEKYDRNFPRSEEYRQKLSKVRSQFRKTGIISYEVTDRYGQPNYQNLRLKHNGDIVVIDYGNFICRRPASV